MTNSSSLITDSVTNQSVRDFLNAEKPANITTVDVLQMVHFLLRKGQDHEIYDSQQTLSELCACDVRTIARSQQRLHSFGWLSRPQRRGRTNALSLNYEKIPSEKAVRVLITQDAKTLSSHYMNELRSKGIKRKFPNAWFARQHLSAQKIIDRCDGDLELATKIVKFAISNPRLQGKAKKSLYELVGAWLKVRATFDAVHPEYKTAEPAQPIMTVPSVQPEQPQPVQPEATQVSQPEQAAQQPSQPQAGLRRPAHPGVGLRWNVQTNEVEDLTTGVVLWDGAIRQRLAQVGLRRDLLSKQFQDHGTYEYLSPDEVNLRLMGSDAWQREGQQQLVTA